MKLLSIIFTLLLIPALQSIGQVESFDRHQTDSLELAHLRDQAWDHVQQASDSASYYLDLLQLKAHELDQPFFICKYHDYSSFFHMNNGEVEESIQASLKAREIAESLNDNTRLTSCTMNLAVNLASLGIQDKAIELYEESLSQFREQNEVRGVETSLFNIANGYQALGDFDTANEWVDSLRVHQSKYGKGIFSVSSLESAELYKNGEIRLALEKLLAEFNSTSSTDHISGLRYGDYLAASRYYSELFKPDSALLYYTMGKNEMGENTQPEFVKALSTTGIVLLKAQKDYSGACAVMQSYRAYLDSLDMNTNYLAIERALNMMAHSSHTEKLASKRALMESMQMKDSQYNKLFWGISIPLIVLLLGLCIVHVLVKEKKLVLDKATQRITSQDKKISDSIEYGEKIQQALFSKSGVCDISRNALRKWQKTTHGSASIQHWNMSMENGVLMCFFHPSSDVVSSAFKAILCNSIFRKLEEVSITDDNQIIEIHNAICKGVTDRLTDENSEVLISMVFCNTSNDTLTIFDGQSDLCDTTPLTDLDNLTVNDLQLSISNGEIAVYSDDVLQLLQAHNQELLEHLQNGQQLDEDTLEELTKVKESTGHRFAAEEKDFLLVQFSYPNRS